MTIDWLKENGYILLECISGSRAYGLATPQSDTDIRGVFYLPKDVFLGMDYIEQINNETNDIVFYELGKFVDLLYKNNPNILELLNTPDDCLLYKHPLMDNFQASSFLSKLCEQTFGNYAMTQIKKARGLNKKVLNPIDQERKSVLDFCYVVQGQGALPLKTFLEQNHLDQSECGLARIDHMPDVYGLYHSSAIEYKGILHKQEANDVSLSSIPKGETPIALMSFNKSAYSSYCKEYKEYWEWVEKRNEVRYQSTLSHGKNYDAKNMMHTFRLLNMAQEIAEEARIYLRRPDAPFLLKIKAGGFEYDELVHNAELKLMEIKEAYKKSVLPQAPSKQFINNLLVTIRTELYK